jgi:hypothetical protein
MKLTIEELSRRTKISVPTLRVYVSRKNLGKREGNKRVFSEDDVQKLLKGEKRSKKSVKAPGSRGKKRAQASRKRGPAKKRAAARKSSAKKSAPVKATPSKPAPAKDAPQARPVQRSFWDFLRGKPKTSQKVGLLEAKTTK